MDLCTLLTSAPDAASVRYWLALLCKERRPGESLTNWQLQEMIGALEARAGNAELAEDMRLIERDPPL